MTLRGFDHIGPPPRPRGAVDVTAAFLPSGGGGRPEPMEAAPEAPEQAAPPRMRQGPGKAPPPTPAQRRALADKLAELSEETRIPPEKIIRPVMKRDRAGFVARHRLAHHFMVVHGWKISTFAQATDLSYDTAKNIWQGLRKRGRAG